ncbi:MAG: hypothetical protein ICV79_08620 [Flavisolibacter sp.]|nr:hypothetical protein [Flavisolibacter sp.]
MENKSSEDLIPEQHSGAKSNTEAIETMPSEEEAKRFFKQVKRRLLNVNNWHEVAGAGTADFQLTDSNGKEVSRTAQIGDYFKIDIPAPGTATGEGHDWVQIEAIEEVENEREESLVIQVRPATNPNNDRNDVAHFFSDEATSSFVVRREGTTVTAGVYGRNEKPNTKAEKVADKIRNTAIATGAISGFAKLHWKQLVNGVLKKE